MCTQPLLTEWRDCKDSIHWIVCVSHSVDPIHEYCLLWVFGCNCASASGKHFSRAVLGYKLTLSLLISYLKDS